MSERTIGSARAELAALQRKMSAYNHAIGLIYYDGETAAPKGTAANRGAALAVLTEEVYRMATSPENIELLEYLDEHKDSLDEKERREVYLLLKDTREMKKIPMDEFVAYTELRNEAEAVWQNAKAANDFEMFRPYLEKIFATEKKFALYIDPEKDPYDQRLDGYEEGLTRQTLDKFFAALREKIVPLLHRVMQAPQIDDSIRFGSFPAYKQEKLAYWLMETIGLDLDHVGLATTEHPFTTNFGSHLDERITTHYHEDDLLSSFYSVVHEGGHALYDTGSDEDIAYTVIDGGSAMSLHESQSRFYENIIGRSRAFCGLVFPKLCELFPEQMKGRTADDLYRAANKAEPSLIRTEADELTYCLHIMVRYELEKRVFDGELEVKDLPAEWNRLYKEYLGIDVPDDTRGVLQDTHWSSGLIGYFPSYALGNAYGAQFLAKMRETVDVDACIEAGDFGPVNAWNRENIWRSGSLYTPAQVLDRVLGAPFDPKYYTDYLEKKFGELYDLK